MSYPKYAWIGNRVSEEDMASLYRLKQQTKKPITVLVAEAISNYLSTTMPPGLPADCPENRADLESQLLVEIETVHQQKVANYWAYQPLNQKSPKSERRNK